MTDSVVLREGNQLRCHSRQLAGGALHGCFGCDTDALVIDIFLLTRDASCMGYRQTVSSQRKSYLGSRNVCLDT